MKEKNKNEELENFSNDPEENLRIENELLRLKIQAERGCEFWDGEDVPPDIENEWLKNIQRFEEEWDKRKMIKVYDFIGKPQFKPLNTILPGEVKAELRRLNDVMAENNLFLDVLGEYEPTVIYKFLTEELFEQEMDDIRIPGWTQNFIYEEFHPNHKMDIEKNTMDFLRHWFESGFNEYSTELSHQMITPWGNIFTQVEMLEKLNNCLSCYISFSEIESTITETKFEFVEGQGGLGHAEGTVHYRANLESGETVTIEGNYKLYMSNENGYWEIFYFIFPGFAW